MDVEIVVRVVLGGLMLGGLVMFLTAPESRRPDVPRSVKGWKNEEGSW